MKKFSRKVRFRIRNLHLRLAKTISKFPEFQSSKIPSLGKKGSTKISTTDRPCTIEEKKKKGGEGNKTRHPARINERKLSSINFRAKSFNYPLKDV